MSRHIEIAGDRHLETLGNCGGYYECPKGPDGRRLGPLVGYAGKYQAPDGTQKQWVGEVYANFAMAETHPHVLKFFAGCLAMRLDQRISLMNIDALVGAPIGGYSLADALGFFSLGMDVQVIKAEKKVVALATPDSREKSQLAFVRHSVEKGLRYVWVEDVCNNFSTTAEGLNLIYQADGEVVAIACFLNRSPIVNDAYSFTSLTSDEVKALRLPVVSVVRKVINEWKQDDPAVAEDVAAGNVVWKPKNEWDRLMQAMQSAR